MVDLSIVFPVHNESEGVEGFIADVISKLKSATLSYEIICVENGSTDDSLEKLKKLQKKYKSLRVIESPKGWGNAIRAGIANAKGKYFCYMISDGQIDPAIIPTLFSILASYHDYSLVKVWRTTRENRVRFINSRLYNFIARFLLGIKSWDINATPKIIESKLIQSIPLTAPNIGFDVELLWHLKKRGFSWVEIPVPSFKRETGTSTTKLRSLWEMTWSMVSLLATNRAESKP